jgi:hypothetical protein
MLSRTGTCFAIIALSIAGRSSLATTATPTVTCACTVSPTRTATCTPGESPHPGCPYSPAPTTKTPPHTPTATPTCTPQSINTCRADQTITCTDLGGSCLACACVTHTPTPSVTCACMLTPTASATATRTCPPAAPPPTCGTGASAVCRDEQCSVDCACATNTPTRTVPFLPDTHTPTPTPEVCVGDCNADGMVRINELIAGVNVLLGNAAVSACPAIDCPQPLGGVFINCGVEAVNHALNGCPVHSPIPVADCTDAPPHQPCTGPCGPPECVIDVSGYCEHGRCVTDCAPCVTSTPERTATPPATPRTPPTALVRAACIADQV